MSEIKVPYVGLKRFAVHDGPGIRTALYLKGCTLRCLWCHNPESRFLYPELGIHYPKCTLCGECTKVCSCHRIEQNEHVFDRKNCTACGQCVESCCFSNALELFGKTITVEEAASQLLEDRIFYAENGGITLSGGEPLVHSDFCTVLLKRMKQEGIHTAVDTCGNVPWSAFEKVLPYSDLFLYDFKCFDPEKHKCLTGCGNALIKENLKKLDECGKPLEIRMVMIPAHTMGKEDLYPAGEFLSALENCTAVRLLAYHSLARPKFRAVGHPDTMPDVPSPDGEMLEKCAGILRACGVKKVINSLSWEISSEAR